MNKVWHLFPPVIRRPLRKWWYRYNHRRNRRRRDANTDVFIVSFPKAGRTWLRVMVGKALCDHFGLPEDGMLQLKLQTELAGLPLTDLTHDYSDPAYGARFDRQPSSKQEYRGKKVIFLIRDVKDLVVSNYFQVTKRDEHYDGDIHDFVRDDRYGARKIIAYYNIWHRNRDVPEQFLLISYEQMHRDPAAVVTTVLELMGVRDIDPKLVADAVEFSRFEKMRKLEASGAFRGAEMKPADQRDPESFKTRKGKVGGYREYLNDEDVRFIDRAIEQMGCPFLAEVADK
jgi:hypothetical protein